MTFAGFAVLAAKPRGGALPAGQGDRVSGANGYVSPVPSGTTPGRIGVNAHHGGPEVARALAAANIRLVRVDMDWAFYLEKTARHDTLYMIPEYQALRDSNVDIFASLGYRYSASLRPPLDRAGFTSCRGAQPNACIPGGPAFATFLREWRAWVTTMVAQQHGRVKYWGVWNEPNERAAFFTGADWQYDSLAHALCDIVHAWKEGLLCVGPEAGVRNPGSRSGDVHTDLAYIAARVRATPAFDIISAHIYDRSQGLFTTAARVKAIAGARPLWITEESAEPPEVRRGGADLELQEKDLAEKVRRVLAGGSPVAALFHYDLQTPEYGLFSDVGMTTPRPAFRALSRLLRQQRYVAPAAGSCTADDAGHASGEACRKGRYTGR